jgi:hypothetical protein
MTPPSAAKALILRSKERLSVFTTAKVKNEVNHSAWLPGVVSDRNLTLPPGGIIFCSVLEGRISEKLYLSSFLR